MSVAAHIKQLGRFEQVGHRITGDRAQRARNVGWAYVFVAVDDHSCTAFTQAYPDESRPAHWTSFAKLRATCVPVHAHPTCPDRQRARFPLHNLR